METNLIKVITLIMFLQLSLSVKRDIFSSLEEEKYVNSNNDVRDGYKEVNDEVQKKICAHSLSEIFETDDADKHITGFKELDHVPYIGPTISHLYATVTKTVKPDIYYNPEKIKTLEGCKDISLEEFDSLYLKNKYCLIKNELRNKLKLTKVDLEMRFNQMDTGLNKNLEIIQNRFDKMESEYSDYGVLKLLHSMIKPITLQVENAKRKLKKESKSFVNKIKKSEYHVAALKIQDFVNYFESEKEKLKSLALETYVEQLEDDNGLILFLANSKTSEPGSLYTLLFDIINNKCAFNDSSKVGKVCLYFIYYGVLNFMSAMLYSLEQNAFLADYYYENRDIDKFNKLYDSILNDFDDFKYTLIDSTLIDHAIQVINEVQGKTPQGVEHTMPFVNKNVLAQIRHQVSNISRPLSAESPAKVLKKPSFKESKVLTPLGKWRGGARIKYAIQYKKGDVLSKVGEWSDSLTVSRKSSPFIAIPGDETRTILVFRQFDDEKPEYVGSLEPGHALFRDIDKDLFNTASTEDEENGIKESHILQQNYADIGKIFDNERSAIHAAAMEGNTKLAKLIILNKNLSHVNVVDRDGYTPLHISAGSGNHDFIRLLTVYGANVTPKTKLKELTPLHIAASKGHVWASKTLLKLQKTNINARDHEGYSPLHSAIIGGDGVVQALLSHPLLDINAKSTNGMTALHIAAINNYRDVIATLLKSKNIDLNAKATAGLTALHLATMAGHTEVVKLLLSNNRTDVNSISANEWTPLIFSISLKLCEISKELLSTDNINVNKAGLDNMTPLHIAAATGQLNTVQLLVQKGALINEVTANGLTALHQAVIYHRLDMVKYLSENGANLYIKDKNNNTAVDIAVLKGYLSIVQYIIDTKQIELQEANLRDLATKANIFSGVKYLIDRFISTQNMNSNALQFAISTGNLDLVKYILLETNEGESNRISVSFLPSHRLCYPIHAAAWFGNLKIINFLEQEEYLDVNVQDTHYRTPLHYACEAGKLAVVKYLIITKKVNATVGDVNNKKPIHYAVENGHLDVTKFLVDEVRVNVTSRDDQKNSPLHYASSSGHLDIVQYLIEDKMVDIYITDMLGNTALHTAARYDHLPIVKYLVHKKADIDKKNTDSNTPLHLAAIHGSLDVIKYLVDGEANADIYGTNNKNNTLLHLAAMFGHVNIVKYLIDEKKAYTNVINIDSFVPLHLAVIHGWLKIVKYFVERNNKDAVIGNKDNDTPLHLAAWYGHVKIVNYLIDEIHINVNIKDNDGWTPAHIASWQGQLGVLKNLIDNKNADIMSRNNVNETPLHLAAFYGFLNIVKYLVNEKKANILVTDNAYRVPLHDASQRGHLDIVQFFIDEKLVDVNVRNRLNWTPLHYACANGFIDIVKYLVEKKADLYAKNNDYDTPIQDAAWFGHVNIIKYLLDDKKVDLNIRGFDNNTLLHTAAKYGRVDLVKYLVNEKMVDINIRNKNNDPPLYLAAWYGHLSVVKFLIDEKNADINVRGDENWTPLHLAAWQGHLEVVKYLVNHKDILINAKTQDNRTALRLATEFRHTKVVEFLNTINGIEQ